MQRLFVAVDLPSEIKERLLKICFGIPGAKWAEKEQLHITLKFIGEVNPSEIDQIHDSLASIQAKAFSIIIKGVGHFPPKKEPKVLWAGVEENEKLNSLQKKIDRALSLIGIPPDTRKFHSHITLARFKEEPVMQKISMFMAEHSFLKSPLIEVKEFALYRSFLSPKGALYEKISEFKLLDN